MGSSDITLCGLALDELRLGGRSAIGIARGDSLGGVSRVGKTPCLEQRPALLPFVLELDRSTPGPSSTGRYVETDCEECVLGRRSGVPNWKVGCSGLVGDGASRSLSILSAYTPDIDRPIGGSTEDHHFLGG